MPATHFSEADFKAKVLQSDKPVLVDFYADWCGPCRAMAPTIEELSHELSGTAVVGKVDVDANQALAEQYQVMSIPTLIVFKGGQPAVRFSGVQNKATVLEKVKALA